jgi:hypothetical protein
VGEAARDDSDFRLRLEAVCKDCSMGQVQAQLGNHLEARCSQDVSGRQEAHFRGAEEALGRQTGEDGLVFLRKLKARVTTVTAPIVRDKQSDVDRKRRVADFDRLSLQDKRTALIDIAFTYFDSLDYAITNVGREGFDTNATPV